MEQLTHVEATPLDRIMELSSYRGRRYSSTDGLRSAVLKAQLHSYQSLVGASSIFRNQQHAEPSLTAEHLRWPIDGEAQLFIKAALVQPVELRQAREDDGTADRRRARWHAAL
jgi:hypothetical protein